MEVVMAAAFRGDNASILADFGPHSAANVAPRSTMATAMMFGTIIFASVALAARMYFAGVTRAVTDAQCPRSSPLDIKSFSSIYTLLYHSTIFGLILLYAYICEYHPPFPHADKVYDRDEFFFLTALLFVVSAFTLSKNDKSKKSALSKESDLGGSETKGQGRVAEVNDANEVLNRDQTEEWKGWMQFMFLLYHYYHGEEVYNAIRIMITCYVWMTGFGNFSFFYLKSDYSAVRVLQMLWRLNFLVVFLCLSQGTTYILYYICLLHTYYFLMVYVTMRIAKHVNYTKWGIRIKLSILALIIFCVWDVKNNLFYMIHRPFLGETPMLGATSGAMWEWYFRSSLDHWSTFLGMIFALNFPITSLFYRKLEAQPLVWHILGKLSMGLALLGVFLRWVMGPFQEGKFQYNATNAYFGFIPLITYIYFRNLTPWLRNHSLDLLHQIGKTTLETYLMQHHIWLTSNAKSLLTLIPGFPKCNMLLVTVLYYVLSRRLYQLTLYLRGMILPDDRNTCLRHLVFLAIAIGGYYGLAHALDSMGILSLTMVLFISVVCGLFMYWIIVDTTWDVYDASAGSHYGLDSSMASRSSRPRTSWRPPIIAGSVVLLLGLFWNSMSIHGAGKIQPLPQGCQEFVNDGAWIPLGGCDEASFGYEYRQYGISSHGTCSSQDGNYVWGWNQTFSASHCRFTHRDSRSLKQMLKHRTITFIGDSISRHLYQAVLRSLGISDAGEYNTHLPKWTDMNATVGDTHIHFEWSPYSKDQVGRMQNITNRPEIARKEGELVRPDLVVLGGGAWDRLHVYGTDEEIASHRSALKDLTIEIQNARHAGIPVAWVIPTTINSNALLTDEKRENINEEKMEEFRAYYAEVGVPGAASFVLDGPVWTRGRVSESYDGVHYPHSVYDAGSQILINAMDWLLPEKDTTDNFVPLEPGTMANPRLGCMMLALAFIGLFFFDGFMGFSYFASLFVPSVSPKNLYEESYTLLHQRKKLPPIDFSAGIKCPSSPMITSNDTSTDRIGNGAGPTTLTRRISGSSEDEETVSLVSVSNGRKLEMA
jgi:hypothetical protein